jgi:pimeloyl-ACP methyl ester carboxylesterase
MELTASIDPPVEPCTMQTPPATPTIPWPFVVDQSESRLIPSLAAAAQTHDPDEILVRAAVLMYGVFNYRAQNPNDPNYQPVDYWLALATADLSVTGRAAYTAFQGVPVTDAGLAAGTSARLLAEQAVSADPAVLADSVAAVLDRAYAVAWALRGPAAQQPAARASLGWIAVSGEDDKPHRPVNQSPPPFEQYEVAVTTHGVTVQTRFFIASAVEPAPLPIAPAARALPPDRVPAIPPGHEVILFLHGHSSGAEEALELIPHLHRAGLDRGTRYSVVCVDLPNNGYSEPFDHTLVAPSAATSFPGGLFDHGPILTPILDYIEDFVVAFVETLDQITPVVTRYAGTIGGSLGGNLGLRLGRRNFTGASPLAPWLNAGIVSWSPASVWDPMVQDEVKRHAPEHCRDMWDKVEDAGSRVGYFYEVYDKPVLDVIVPYTQPELWYRDDWQPCKRFHIGASRIARQEIYNPSFRRWHWRVAGEQLIYSHVDRVDHEDPTSPRRYEFNLTRDLLVSGQLDNYIGSDIFDATRNLASLMVNTPGASLFLNDTGHSIHVERPQYFAGQIVSFLLAGAPAVPPPPTDVSYLVPLLLG